MNLNVEYYILRALAASITSDSTHIHTVSSDPGVVTSTASSNPDGTTGLYVENSRNVSSITVVDGNEQFVYSPPAPLPADAVVSF